MTTPPRGENALRSYFCCCCKVAEEGPVNVKMPNARNVANRCVNFVTIRELSKHI